MKSTVEMTRNQAKAKGYLACSLCGPDPLITEIALARKSGAPIVILNIGPAGPNFLGGVDVSINYANATDKVIKYAHFTLRAYNAVGDPEKCTIQGQTFQRVRDIGPLNPGKRKSCSWGNVWWNSAIHSIEITQVDLEFMDSTKRRIVGQSLTHLFCTRLTTRRFTGEPIPTYGVDFPPAPQDEVAQ